MMPLFGSTRGRPGICAHHRSTWLLGLMIPWLLRDLILRMRTRDGLGGVRLDSRISQTFNGNYHSRGYIRSAMIELNMGSLPSNR